jgi:hypothetical protein
MIRSWYACEHPERPTDSWVLWHQEDCRACAVKAWVTVEEVRREGPTLYGGQWLYDITLRFFERFAAR